MAIIDVVKWDGTPDVFAYKHPEENLTTFTQLIVNESQEAVFFHKGKLIAKFGPGKHTLSTENIPVLEKLYGIPFGGKNPFTAEVWFVNKVYQLDVKWGTPTPIQLKEPEYKVMVPVRANGQFGIKINDAETFLVKLVGTLPSFDKLKLVDCFRGMLLSNITAIIASKIVEEKISVLEIAAHIQKISEALKVGMGEGFAEFGVHLQNFYINSINIDDNDEAVVHLKSLLSKKAEMNILGYTYAQERSFDVLDNAAQNTGSSGAVMGAGMGMGMGFGVGGAVGGMMGNMMQNVSGDSVACSACNARIPSNVGFCPVCGKSRTDGATLNKAVKCDNCGKDINENAKFCPHCGDSYNPCPHCGADNKKGASRCVVCGKGFPVPCPKCDNAVSETMKFCPSCGESLQKTCGGCGGAIQNGVKFCPDCGTKTA